MDIVNYLLLNMFVVIAPLLLYHLFWTDRIKVIEDVVNTRLITLLTLASAIICMFISLNYCRDIILI
jgi:two-component system sporulation sensor kinase B